MKTFEENETVDRETNLGQIVYQYPKTAEIMLEYGLHCAGCFANQFDSVAQGAAIHGMSDEEVDEMLQRINELIKKSNEENS